MNNLLEKCNFEYIIYITLAIIIIVVLYIFLKDSMLFSSKDKNIIVNIDIKSDNDTSNDEYDDKPNTKILKYFGGSFCPHSRIGSKAYKLVEEIDDMYDDVTVEYYWSDKDEKDKNEFKLANIKYVPTLTNCYNEVIDLKIPNSIDTSDKSEDELKQFLIQTIYYKL